MSDATNKLENSQDKLFEVERVNKNLDQNTPETKTEVREEIPAEYEVEKGDTVYTIAHKYGLTQGKVISLNNIEDPRALKVGQKLKLRG